MRNLLVITCLVALLSVWLPRSASADHQVTRWYGGRGAAVSLTFDDGLYSQCRIGAPLVEAHGFKGSFYIMTDAGWEEWPNYWEDWAAVAAAGHEIGSHTITHAHLASLTEVELRYELRESRKTIELMIEQPPGMTIAYPYGETTPLVENIAEEYYIAGRVVWSPGYMNYYSEDSDEAVDFRAIGSFAFDYPGLTTYEILASFVDDAEATHGWFIPHIHELESPQAEAVLTEFLEDLQARQNVWVGTLGSVVRYMREREAVAISATESTSAITLQLAHELDPEIYTQLLTIRSIIPLSWSAVAVSQDGYVQMVDPLLEDDEAVVYYDVSPNGGTVQLTPGTIYNLAPDVDAGPDHSIVLPMDSVFLDGTIADDGLPIPPGLVTADWSMVSGPGTVVFEQATAEDTLATFGGPGTYVLRLTAEDGEWVASDEVTVQFDEEAAALTVEAAVAAGSDDAEEAWSGTMYLDSSDLELVYDSYNGAGNQTVGLRFVNLAIPAGAAIIGAYLQFKVDEATSDPCLLTLTGQAADNPPTFSLTNGDLSSRPTTLAFVPWGPLEWPVVGEQDLYQRSPDLAVVVQEIVDRPGWNSGQALVLLLTGSGKRTAESRDGDSAGAPRLVVEYTLGPAPNKPPFVSAGPDQSLVAPQASIFLDGTVADDGQPGAVDAVWSQVGGPAGVLIQQPSALNTMVTFPGPGLFTLRLTANDGEFEVTDEMLATVHEEPSGLVSISVAVAHSNDDAEEATNQQMYLDSSDLELVYDAYNSAGNQTVGLRFAGIAIPSGATIVNAWVQFKVDETSVDGCVLTVRGQAADDAAAFQSASGNISSRPLTNTSVNWVPDAWPVVGAAGVSQRTADLSSVVQEVVNRPGWSSGNALALVLTGSGKRVAESYDGESAGAPVLHIEFGVGEAVNKPPTVDAGPDQQLTLSVDSAWLAGSVADDGLPLPPGALTLAWTQVSGPGPVDFVDSTAAATTAFFPAAGTYVLQLTADDGQWQVGDQVLVDVFEGGGGIEVVEVAVASSLGDVEESSAGTLYVDSSDLELVNDTWEDAGNQTVGLRFSGVALPQGATIVAAYVQFKVDETGSEAASLTIHGQAADQAAAFQGGAFDVSGRPLTEASKSWSPSAWNAVGAMGPEQRTADLAPILQEIVNRPGWTSGSSMVLVLTGSGRRTAEAYDGDPSGAPLLHIEFTLGAPL